MINHNPWLNYIAAALPVQKQMCDDDEMLDDGWHGSIKHII